MESNLKAIRKTVSLTNEWINDVQVVYDFKDADEAFLLLRATLKALRDRIQPNEAVDLGSQLTPLLRGYYYEGWDPQSRPTRDRDQFDFLTSVKSHLLGHDGIDLEMAVPEIMRLILEKIDQAEARQVVQNLPDEIKDLFN